MIGSYKGAHEVGVINRATGIGGVEVFNTLIVKMNGQLINRNQCCAGCLADIHGVANVVIVAVGITWVHPDVAYSTLPSKVGDPDRNGSIRMTVLSNSTLKAECPNHVIFICVPLFAWQMRVEEFAPTRHKP